MSIFHGLPLEVQPIYRFFIALWRGGLTCRASGALSWRLAMETSSLYFNNRSDTSPLAASCCGFTLEEAVSLICIVYLQSRYKICTRYGTNSVRILRNKIIEFVFLCEFAIHLRCHMLLRLCWCAMFVADVQSEAERKKQLVEPRTACMQQEVSAS